MLNSSTPSKVCINVLTTKCHRYVRQTFVARGYCKIHQTNLYLEDIWFQTQNQHYYFSSVCFTWAALSCSPVCSVWGRIAPRPAGGPAGTWAEDTRQERRQRVSPGHCAQPGGRQNRKIVLTQRKFRMHSKVFIEVFIVPRHVAYRPVPWGRPPPEPALCSQGSGLAALHRSPGTPAGGALAPSLLSPDLWNTTCACAKEDNMSRSVSSWKRLKWYTLHFIEKLRKLIPTFQMNQKAEHISHQHLLFAFYLDKWVLIIKDAEVLCFNKMTQKEILPAFICETHNPCPLVFPRMQLLQGLLPLWYDITDLAKWKQVILQSDSDITM